MGSEKKTETQVVNQTSTPTPDPSLVEQNKLDLEARKANQSGLINVQQGGLDLSNLLLRGQNLPGYLKDLPYGISPDVTQGLVDQSLRDIQPYFQQGGLLDSGTKASVMGRTAGDIRRTSAEFNLGNLQQLLNLAVGGQAQVQQPILAQSQALGSRLAGLTSWNQTGNTTNITKSMNPFLKSFQTSLGQTLGSPSFKSGGFGF